MNNKTLLDEFAMAALSGMLADPGMDAPAERLAATCYNMAEAMMAERAKRMPASPANQDPIKTPAAPFPMFPHAGKIENFVITRKGQRMTCTEIFKGAFNVSDTPSQAGLLEIGKILRHLGFRRVRSGGKDYYQL